MFPYKIVKYPNILNKKIIKCTTNITVISKL